MDVVWCLLAALGGGAGGWWWCRRIWRRRWAVERDGRAREGFAADVQLREATHAFQVLERLRAEALTVAVATSVVDQALRGRSSWELES